MTYLNFINNDINNTLIKYFETLPEIDITDIKGSYEKKFWCDDNNYSSELSCKITISKNNQMIHFINFTACLVDYENYNTKDQVLQKYINKCTKFLKNLTCASECTMEILTCRNNKFIFKKYLDDYGGENENEQVNIMFNYDKKPLFCIIHEINEKQYGVFHKHAQRIISFIDQETMILLIKTIYTFLNDFLSMSIVNDV